ncbi:MAG: efflux RND transporter periplasmic adaptor subunit [Planctomycetota bacterium]
MTLLVLSAQTALAQGGPPPAAVKVDRVRIETMQDRREVTGSLRPIARAEVAALEEGRVVAVHVQEADAVEAGDVLAELDARRIAARIASIDAELAVQQATIRQRRAELDRAQREFERLTELQGSAAATIQELEDVESGRDVARALLDAAERRADQIDRQRDLLQVSLDDTRIIAPFAGRVVEQHVEVGEWIDPGDAVVTLIADHHLEAWLDVPERYKIDILSAVNTVSIEVLAANEVVESDSTRVVPQLDPRIRNFVLIADVANDEGHLASGMSVIAWVPIGTSKEYLVVPKKAVQRDQMGYTVWVALEVEGGSPPDGGGGGGSGGSGGSSDGADDGSNAPSPAYVAEAKRIQRAFETDTDFILAGPALSAGDLVVVEGNERLMMFQPLRLIDGPPATPDGQTSRSTEDRNSQAESAVHTDVKDDRDATG